MRKLLLGSVLLCSSLFSTTIYVSPTGSTGGDGSSGAPYDSVQRGINESSDGDTVILEDGTYHEHNLHLFGKEITVGSRYVLDGDTAHVTACVIDGDSTNSDSGSVFCIVQEVDTNTVLAGFTITRGTGTFYQTYKWTDYYGGGGIYLADTDYGLWLDHCVITANCARYDDTAVPSPGTGIEAEGHGGGVFKGILLCRNCSISGNTAYAGGGFYKSNGTWNDCTISQNRAKSRGGGFWVEGTVRLTGSAVNENSSSWGGGFYGSIYSTAKNILVNCTVSGNSGINLIGSGGGFYNCTNVLTGCTVSNDSSGYGGAFCGCLDTLTDCTVSGNYAKESGGAWDIRKAYLSAYCIRCTVSNNYSRNGGAFYIDNGSSRLDSCLLEHNDSPYGGCFLCTSDGSTEFYGCTARYNTAGSSGGFVYGGYTTLCACIVSNNTAGKYAGAIYLGPSADITYSTFCNNTSDTIDAGLYAYPGASLDLTLNNCITTDTLALNGGEMDSRYSLFARFPAALADSLLTAGSEGNLFNVDPKFADTVSQDFHLLSNSPAIDAGSPDSSYANEPNCSGANTRVDMGVYGNTAGATCKSNNAYIDCIPDSFSRILAGGEIRYDTLTVVNDSLDPLLIHDVTEVVINDTDLVCTGLSKTSTTLEQGDTCLVYLAFTAAGARVDTIPVKINFEAVNSGVEVPYEVTVAGTYDSLFGNFWEFGYRTKGVTHTDTFYLKNRGSNRLVIDSLREFHDRFAFSTVYDDFSIMPGDSAAVSVDFSPTNDKLYSTRVYLYSPNLNVVDSTLEVLGTGVNTDITVVPDTLSFGNVLTGDSALAGLVVRNDNQTDLSVTDFSFGSPAYRLQGVSAFTLTPGTQRTCTVVFAPETTGTYPETVAIANSSMENPSYTVRLEGRGVAPAVSFSATDFSFGQVRAGSYADDTLTIYNYGDGTLKIDSLVSGHPWFEIIGNRGYQEVAAGAETEVGIRFAPDSMSAAISSGIVIHSNDGGAPDTISVAGTGTDVVLSLSPVSVDFGDRSLNMDCDTIIDVINAGNAPATIDSVVFTHAAFSKTTSLTGIGAGGSVPVTVACRVPGAAGQYSGAMKVYCEGSFVEAALTVNAVAPILIFSRTQVDFGTVRTGTSRDDSLLIGNSGNGALAIDSIRSTHDWFAVNGNTGQRTLAPGDSSLLRLSFAPDTLSAAVKGTVLVYSNAGDSARVITVTGTGTDNNVYPEFTSLAFGNVNLGAYAETVLTVYNDGNAEAAIDSVTFSHGAFTNRTLPGVIAARSNATITIRFTPPTGGPGQYTASLRLHYEGTFEEVTLAGAGVAPDLSLSTALLAFGEVRAGTSHGDSLQIRNRGAGLLEIDSIRSTHDWFLVQGNNGYRALDSGAVSLLRISFAPAEASAGISGAVIIFSNDAGSPDTVTVTGTGTASQLTAGVSAVHFGAVGLLGSRDTVLTVRNNGNAVAVVDSVTFDSPAFSKTTVLDNIGAGNSVPLTLRFAPSDPDGGDYGGRLRIYYETSFIEVQLTGKAVGDPTCAITRISPSTTAWSADTDITFIATAEDADVAGVGFPISFYQWTSSLTGDLGRNTNSFTKSAADLGIGTHIISLRVVDNEGDTSDAAIDTLVILSRPPVVSIDSISPAGLILKTGGDVSIRCTAYDADEYADNDHDSLTSFRLISSLQGVLSRSKDTVLAASSLQLGLHGLVARAVDDEGDTVTTDTLWVPVQTAIGRAVLVAGTAFDDFQYFYNNINPNINWAYKKLKDRGFTDEQIYYMNPVGWQSIGDPYADAEIVDETQLTKEKLHAHLASLKSDIQNSVPLVLVFVGHGNAADQDGKFYLNPTEYMTPEDLGGWLDEYEDLDLENSQITVILDFCYSGTFFSKLRTLYDQNRYIVTASDKDNAAYFADGKSFSWNIFNQVYRGKSLKRAFERAKSWSDANAPGSQTANPQLNCNGNSLPNESMDYSLADKVYIGGSQELQAVVPEIESAVGSVYVTGTSTDSVRLSVTTSGEVADLWARVIGPDYSMGDPIENEPVVTLASAGSNAWSAADKRYFSAGDYLYIIEGADAAGNGLLGQGVAVTVTHASGIDAAVLPESARKPRVAVLPLRILNAEGYELTITGIDGHRVMTRTLRSADYTWDGTDGSGVSVRAGIYFYRLTGRGRTLPGKILCR